VIDARKRALRWRWFCGATDGSDAGIRYRHYRSDKANGEIKSVTSHAIDSFPGRIANGATE
jgi:hypothetical protein